jgi:hypothetical protein
MMQNASNQMFLKQFIEILNDKIPTYTGQINFKLMKK